MNETILLAQGNHLHKVHRSAWEQHLVQIPDHGKTRLAFMTEAHQRVRYFVVEEMIRTRRPITPKHIAFVLEMAFARVIDILDDLERNLFFLARNGVGEVVWAYPVTVNRTPHRITFSSGEELYAA